MISYTFDVREFEFFLLILARMASFIFAAPFFSMNNVPRRVRTALAVFVSILVYSSMEAPEVIPYETSVWSYAALVIREVLVGVLIGAVSNMCLTATAFAGNTIDMNVGLSMVSLLDPATREQVTFTGAFYNYFYMLILIASGLYRYLLKAMVDTYTLIPIGRAVFRQERFINLAISFLSGYMLIGFQIALPIFVATLILNSLLGIMAKVAPQMNMFAVGMQIKILMGMTVLLATIYMMPQCSDLIFREIRTLVVSFVEAMMP